MAGTSIAPEDLARLPELTISPASAEILAGDACPFRVAPGGIAVEWRLSPEVGSIDQRGVYSSPERLNGVRSIVVLAQERGGARYAAATITLSDAPQRIAWLGKFGLAASALIATGVLLFWTLLAGPRREPMVVVNPPEITFDTLKGEDSYAFTATVLGDAKSAVVWSVPEGVSISSSGALKIAGSGKGGTFTIKATSVSDPSRFGTAIVHAAPDQARREVLPQGVAAFPRQQIAFRMADNSEVYWSLSRGDLGVMTPKGAASRTGIVTVGDGIRTQEPLQVTAWGADGAPVAAAVVVVNPAYGSSAAGSAALLAFVMVMGALGSMLHFSSSFVEYVGNRTFKASWFWYYVSRPFVGAGLAVIFFFLCGAGWVSQANAGGLMTVATVSALVGLFSDKAVRKLSDILDTVLAAKDERKDKVNG
jgi:hypothetical protein